MENLISNNPFEINYKDISPKYKNGQLIGYNMVEDNEAIKNSLKNLFTIKKGEVPGKPWIGNPINIFLFDNIDIFQKQAITAAFINTIENYEPRVKIMDLNIDMQPEYNNINITLHYSIILSTNSNLETYRFSLNYNNLTNITLREI